MIVLAGGNVVVRDRVLPGATVLVDGTRVVEIATSRRVDIDGAARIDLDGALVLPGFIDVHVHGVHGHDTLDEGDPVAHIAALLPRYGVTAFCPTTVACGPRALARFLAHVAAARARRPALSARVLPAHLESNFINPEYCGAQPAACLRVPDPAALTSSDGEFSAGEILAAIAGARADVGIVTLAPELPGGLDLIRTLVGHGHRVSLGHSGADFETAVAAIDAGARQATHLFNRMTAISHRAPGLPGAVLAREDVAAELIGDGYHVHPAMVRVAIAAKRAERMMAITDGTGGSGLPPGSRATLGGRSIHVRPEAAFLDDGTLAGSTLTMDGAFRNLVRRFGVSIVDAATMCATTPANELGLSGRGAIEAGSHADLVILDDQLRVARTFIDGAEVYRRAI